MDVVFALDSSYEIKPSAFDQQRSFVLTMIDGFTISQSQTHVGLITVSETARKDIELIEYSQSGTLKAKVDELRAEKVLPSLPTSRLSDMLRKAFEIFKNGGRSEVSFMLLDGNRDCALSQPTTHYSLLLRTVDHEGKRSDRKCENRLQNNLLPTMYISVFTFFNSPV